MRFPHRAAPLLFTLLACSRDKPARTPERPFLVYVAASIAQPIRVALDSFARRSGARYELEGASSLELVRRVTALHADPDVIVLADPLVLLSLIQM